MRVNDHVGFFDAEGKRHDATVTAIVGAGKSHYKTLDLSYRQEGATIAVPKVSHENDAESGDVFWLEKGVARAKAEPPEPEPKPKRKHL